MNGLVLAVGLAMGTLPGLPDASDATCLLGEGMPLITQALVAPEAVTDDTPPDVMEPLGTDFDPELAAECLVPYGQVPEGAQLIDTRSRRALDELWVEGALHEPSLARLRQAPVYEGAVLALFGTGHDDARVANACAQLKAAGVEQVVAVRHGLRALSAAGVPIHGNLHALQGLSTLDARALHEQLAIGPLTILDASGLSDAEREALGADVRWVDSMPGRSPQAIDWERIDVVLLPVGRDGQDWIHARVPHGIVAPPTFSHGLEALASYVAESTFRAAERVRTAPLRCAS